MAERYWVGGSGTWNSTAGTKWATTSGGVGGASVPTSSDDVIFDANSGSVLVVVDTTAMRYARFFSFNNFLGTFSASASGGAGIDIYGSLSINSPGMTFNYNSGLTFSGTTSASIVPGGKLTGNNNLTINKVGAYVQIGEACSFNILTLTQGDLILYSPFGQSDLVSCQRFVSSNSNNRSVDFSTAGIKLTSTTAAALIIDASNSLNFTCTGTYGFYRDQVASANVNFGSSSSTPPNLFITGGSSSLTIATGSKFQNITCTGSTCTVSGTYNAAGNLVLASGGTYTGLNPTFIASGIIACNGKTLGNTTVNGSGITVLFNGAFTSQGSLDLVQGTINTFDNNVTVASFGSNNSNTRSLIMGSGTWTITGSGSFAWNIATTTGMSLTPNTSTINMTSAFAKTFVGGGLTYYNLNQGGSGTLTISGSNTFNNITNSVQPATVTFTAGTTQTVSNFGLSGTSGNLITINSATAGSQFTLSKSSGTVNAQYLSIQDSNATGGAVWYSFDTTNVNLGNNSGWIFSPSAGGAFMQFF